MTKEIAMVTIVVRIGSVLDLMGLVETLGQIEGPVKIHDTRRDYNGKDVLEVVGCDFTNAIMITVEQRYEALFQKLAA